MLALSLYVCRRVLGRRSGNVHVSPSVFNSLSILDHPEVFAVYPPAQWRSRYCLRMLYEQLRVGRDRGLAIMQSQDYLLNGRLVNNMVKMLFTRCKVHILYDIIQGTIVYRRSLQRSFNSIKSSRPFGFDSTTLNTKTTRSNSTRRSIRYSCRSAIPPSQKRSNVCSSSSELIAKAEGKWTSTRIFRTA